MKIIFSLFLLCSFSLISCTHPRMQSGTDAKCESCKSCESCGGCKECKAQKECGCSKGEKSKQGCGMPAGGQQGCGMPK